MQIASLCINFENLKCRLKTLSLLIFKNFRQSKMYGNFWKTLLVFRLIKHWKSEKGEHLSLDKWFYNK